MANGYEQEIGRQNIGSCGVARSIIVGFHPADPGSNPGTSTPLFFGLKQGHCIFAKRMMGKSARDPLEPGRINQANVPFWKSRIAWWISSRVFMTNGP